MGWFWDSKPAGSDDAYSKLDPGLRDFLDKESPQHRAETQHKTDTSEQPSYRSQLGFGTSTTDQHNQTPPPNPNRPAVPSESLYQDGRYADLWANYRPQSEIEAASKSDQDRMRDVIDAFNDRRAAIGRAAMENCVLEQMSERDCWENGTLYDKMKMCKGPGREFNRCYTMQSRFLKALGYLSVMRSQEEEEKIQMHADTLYHQMLEREAVVAEAQKEGLPAPKMPPLIAPDATMAALGRDSAWARARKTAEEMGETGQLSSYTAEKQAEIKKRVEGLGEMERELELQLIAAESRAHLDFAERYGETLEAERLGREDRRDRGRERVGDTLKRMWGWDRKG